MLHELLEPRLLRIGRTLKLAALGILVLGVTVSYSRAAWLNLGVAVIVMLAVMPLRRGGTRRAGALLLTLVAVLGAAAATVTLTGSSSFFEQRAHLQTYDSQRFGAQRSGIEIAETHPIGVGPGQFEYVAPISAHSTYVRALAEEGVLGALALVSLLIGTLDRGRPQRDPRPRDGGAELDGAAGGVGRAAGQQRLRRHLALAPPVDPRRA